MIIDDSIRIQVGDTEIQAAHILVATGAGFGEFEDPADMAGAPKMMPTDRWELADLNGDGRLDIACANESSNTVTVILTK